MRTNHDALTETDLALVEPLLQSDYPWVRIGRRVLQILALLVVSLSLVGLFVAPAGTRNSPIEMLSFIELVALLVDVAIRGFLLALGADVLGLLVDVARNVRGLAEPS